MRPSCAGLPAERFRQLVLPLLDQLVPAALLVTEAESLLRRLEQGPQKHLLPLVPHARANRANVDDGQDQQQPQALRALHLPDEILDGLRVCQVALERRRRHQEVMAHEPGDRLRFRRLETETRAELHRDLLAEHAMVAPAALRDVVQQHRDIESPPRTELLEQGRRERMVLLELAALDRGEQADSTYRMLIDRIVVIHVELHLRDDSTEVGNETAEHTCLVHPAKDKLGRGDAGQDLEEQSVGTRVPPDILVYELRIARRNPPGGRMDLQRLTRGKCVKLKQAARILDEIIVARDRQPPAIEDESGQALGPPPDGRQSEAEPLLAELLVELREEDAGKVADRLRIDEVELHEALDGRLSGPVGVAHHFGDLLLMVEAQPVLRAPRGLMQVAAHRPEEALGALELPEFRGREQPQANEIGRLLDAMHIFADPVERMEVAKAALAVLYIGLDHISRVAHAAVALVSLGKLCSDELGRGPVDDLRAEALHRLIENSLLAPHQPGFEECGANGHVRPGQRDQLIHRADRVADLQLQLPHQVEEGFDGLFLRRRCLCGGEEHEVEITEGRHLAAASSAQRNESHRLRRIAGRDEIISEANQLIVEVGGRARRCSSAVGLQRQAQGDFRSALFQRPAKELRREALPVGSGGKRSERVGDTASVDDGARPVDGFEERSAHRSLALHIPII